jgi:hypothetical protein
VPSLPAEWIGHLASGVSHRVGSVDASGRPAIGRGLAAEVDAAGVVTLLVSRAACADVIDAIGQTGHVSAVFARPTTHRTLHLKGRDARVAPAGPELQPLLEARREAFIAEVEPLGFTREQLMGSWYGGGHDDTAVVRFTICGAWNQTPGPGAGAAVALA